MKLKKSRYDNKEVINQIKSAFSIIESGGTNSSFTDSQNFFECVVSVSYKDNIYKVSITDKYLKENLINWNPTPQYLYFTNRTNAIKCILKKLKIIK
tara:strand:+ start:106 stop:396 length:291 start_codon:yes stop_codon:yes gene_type:complete